jgi:hypothetical protein
MSRRGVNLLIGVWCLFAALMVTSPANSFWRGIGMLGCGNVAGVLMSPAIRKLIGEAN